MTPSDIKESLEKRKKIFFHTELDFLREHNGFRPGYTHAFIAPISVGKSTMIRSVILDIIKCNPTKKILLYLTEESKEDFLVEIAQTASKFGPEQFEKFMNLFNERIVIWSESSCELPEGEVSGTYPEDKIFHVINSHQCDIIVMDNITTSEHYISATPASQARIVSRMKKFIKHEQIPLVIVAHTKKGTNLKNGLYGVDDIRGSGALSLLVEYSYPLFSVITPDQIFSILRVEKNRTHNKTTSSFYAMKYHSRMRYYTKSENISVEMFNTHFKNRIKIGEAK